MQGAAVTLSDTRIGGMVTASMREHSWIIALIAAYAAYGLFVSAMFDRTDVAWPVLYLQFFVSKTVLLLSLYFVGRLLHGMLIVRPARLLTHVWKDFTANRVVHQQLAVGLPLVIFVPVFLSVFTTQKSLIPQLNSFGWDVTFANWDRFVHGGIEPWRIVQSVVVHPVVTLVIDLLYRGWFYLIQVICLWQAFSLKRPQLRMQFFFSFVLIWILLGNFAAVFLSSAGPVYYESVVGVTGPYEPLLEYLHNTNLQFPLWAVEIQKQLWHAYLHSDATITRGISAMPSIHVSLAFLMALVGWRVSRWLGIALTAYLVAVMIGSVHLAWHYAIDGYAGVIGTYVIWRTVGWTLARRSTVAWVSATA